MTKVFIVEDDESIRDIVVYALGRAGFEAAGFETGGGFFEALAFDIPSLVLLDIMLPGDDGLSILQRLRSAPATSKLPVIMLTAKGSEYDKVKGLDMGADDYIAKPFGVMELISRVNAVLRRSGGAGDAGGVPGGADGERLEVSGIALDHARREVRVGGELVKLTLKEYGLLHYLMCNRGLALSRDKLLEVVWGYDFEGESRTVDMHVKTLRRKLGEHGRAIATVRGVGYKLEIRTNNEEMDSR
jgi:two-component system alkaline phosphatase synthesis response regulator PhoP